MFVFVHAWSFFSSLVVKSFPTLIKTFALFVIFCVREREKKKKLCDKGKINEWNFSVCTHSIHSALPFLLSFRNQSSRDCANINTTFGIKKIEYKINKKNWTMLKSHLNERNCHNTNLFWKMLEAFKCVKYLIDEMWITCFAFDVMWQYCGSSDV